MKIKKTNVIFFLLFIFMFSFSNHTFANTNNFENISIGTKITINSAILGEKREIFIHLPENYGKKGVKFPVLYTLDGRSSFLYSAAVAHYFYSRRIIPNLIVVAIPNLPNTRNRDFTPSKAKDLPKGGGAKNFTKFLTHELIPYMNKNYNTSNFKILYGHSLCGLYVLNTMLDNNNLFNAYIAASPYVMYDEDYTLKKIANMDKVSFKKNTSLYIAIGNEKNYKKPVGKFVKMLKQKADNTLTWHFEQMNEHTHSTITLDTLELSFNQIFNNFNPPANLTTLGLDKLINYINTTNNLYGNNLVGTEKLVNLLGYQYLAKGRVKKALHSFKYNVENFPESPNTYDSLGEAYEKANNLNLARRNYIIAVKKGEKMSDRNTAIYKKHLKTVEFKLRK